MSSRDRRESLDLFEISVRDSLLARADSQTPAPDVRRRLLQRAGRQQRRFPWLDPMSWPGQFREHHSTQDQLAVQHNMLYVQGVLGPRLGWFSFSQLMR